MSDLGAATAAGFTPYYTDEFVTIYHDDCREVVPRLSTDVLLTDPPYGIGLAANPFRQKFARSDWDAAPPDDAVLKSFIAANEQSIVWGGNYFGLPAHQRFLVWDKVQPENFSSAMCEIAWTNLSGPAKLFKKRVVGYEKFHPTQKPVELMRWCLTFTEGVVVDPFMGSGTTLRAAKDLGRKAIGIELEERYCEIAAQRCAQDVLDLGMAA